MPISGKIIEFNDKLESNPELLNQDPYEAGWIIKVELQDLKGTPLKGFQIEDCIELFGGAIDEQVVWNSRINLGSIAGKQIRLRFLFNDADIYSFKFND